MALTEEQVRLLKARGFLQTALSPLVVRQSKGSKDTQKRNEKRKRKKDTLSFAERERRELLRIYNQGLMSEGAVESRLFKNFQLSLVHSTHVVNRTAVRTTGELRLYIALRSRRYLHYAREVYPDVFTRAIAELREKKEERKWKMEAKKRASEDMGGV